MRDFFRAVHFILYMVCLCFFIQNLLERDISAIIWFSLAVFNIINYINLKDK